MDPKYGDIVRVTSSSINWQPGEVFKVIVTEGDGTVGLLRHSLCFKYLDDCLSQDYLYEIPWDDMEYIGPKYKLTLLDKRIEPLEQQKKEIDSDIEQLKIMKECHAGADMSEENKEAFKVILRG